MQKNKKSKKGYKETAVPGAGAVGAGHRCIIMPASEKRAGLYNNIALRSLSRSL
jgi:hypothetical protein